MDGGVLADRAFRWRESFGGLFGRTRLRRYTFKGNTMAVSDVNRLSANNGGTSSNVVISRFKVQVQLESLILAQSERWRQA